MDRSSMQGTGVFQGDSDDLTALKAGDSDAWRVVLVRYGPSLLAYATRLLGDRASGEEITQDSLVNIYRTIDRFDGRCSLKSWLYRAVHNRAIDEIRRRKRYVDVGDTGLEDYFNGGGRWRHDCLGWDGLAAKQLDDKRLLGRVQEQMGRLPHAHREVLLLKEVEGLDSAEICAALEISPGNLRLRIHRARAALRAAVVEA
ncbi:MAG TPA: RNA polymerase sigma factor [Sphingomonadales bacterium]|nr:RNA polymerase sigma factor [Sphingomonadales bacterium]